MKTVTSPNLRTGDEMYSVVLKPAPKFARGGLVRAADKVRSAGRYGDDMLVHMNKAEFEMLRRAWGEPTYNPKTRMPEYFALGSLIGPAISIVGGLLGAKHSGGNSGVNPAPYSDPNMATPLPQWTNQRTVIPHTNPSDYFTYGQTSNPHPGEWSFFGNNSLSNVGPAPPPPPAAPPGGPRRGIGRPWMFGGGPGRAQGGPVGYAFGGPVMGLPMQPPMNMQPAPPPMTNQPAMGLAAGAGKAPPPFPAMNPQLAAMQSMPPGGGLMGGLGAGARPGGAGSMPGSSMALQRPQGPANAPPMGGGGLQSAYARPQGMLQGRPFADGGPVGPGPGSGREDRIPALLSPHEYIVDSESMGLLGDGSPEAGAKKMDAMRQRLRQHKGAALAKGKFTPKAKMPWDYMNDMKARDDMNAQLKAGIK